MKMEQKTLYGKIEQNTNFCLSITAIRKERMPTEENKFVNYLIFLLSLNYRFLYSTHNVHTVQEGICHFPL